MASRKPASDEPLLDLATDADREPEDTVCIIDGCGGAYVFDPLLEGVTVGGNHLIGWLVCDRCKGTCITRRAVPGGGWKLAGGGRSIDADGLRLRAEGGGLNTPAVMARIARLPELERALRSIARGDFDPTSIARAALGLA